jgi:hypothetical protein
VAVSTASLPDGLPVGLPAGLTFRKGDPLALARALEASRPVSLAAEQILPVSSALRDLLPWGGLTRGSTVAVRGSAARSFALALVAEAIRDGAWLAAIGIPSLGLAAVAGFGIALERVVVVEPANSPDWLSAVGAAIDAFDVVFTTSLMSGSLMSGSLKSGGTRAADLRRFQPRVRERGCVVVVLDTVPAAGRAIEPVSADVTIDASVVRWHGLHIEAGYLAARQVAVTVTGRRGAVRPVRRRLWLPDHDGAVRVVPERVGSVRLVAGE